MRRVLFLLSALLWTLVGIALALLWPDDPPPPTGPVRLGVAPVAIPDRVARGRYLARAGDCMPCHTARGGVPYAGGRAIPTPFGIFHTPNLTPDDDTGLGRWTAEDFWNALHEGRSRDGSLLYPAFPYTNYTRVTREDSDAIYAYLRTLPPVRAPRRAHQLRFPYRHRALLAGWRLLYFQPRVFAPDPNRSDEWNRGAYLVQGLGHCSACHESRNALGAMTRRDNPAGGVVLNWYAPSLESSAEAGVAGWPRADVVALLATGHSARGSAMGPMAEVVYESLQHLTPTDLEAMATYLQSLPDAATAPRGRRPRLSEAERKQLLAGGEKLYGEHCADCHGGAGEGRAPAAPPLAGNRALVLDSAVNAIHIVLHGGYPPGTRGNPRPFGMPPYGHQLQDAEIAAVLSYVRNSWGNQAPVVLPLEVQRQRSGPLW